jgi:RHS repeat-associated protein
MTTAAICATREVSRSTSFYRGEQYDSDLGLYYLRARYYNPATGRFLSRDPLDGNAIDPASLHKYLYAGGDPVNGWDSTGRAFLVDYELENAPLPALRAAIIKIPAWIKCTMSGIAFVVNLLTGHVSLTWIPTDISILSLIASCGAGLPPPPPGYM